MPVAVALICVIVGVADGDTLSARCNTDAGAVTMHVRLAEIDAPERQQPFGAHSRANLAHLCFRQRAEVRATAAGGGHDRYGRTVARVTCNGTDANAEQVRSGMAWVFDRYVVDLTLYRLQERARAERRGLWFDPSPVAPWQWRKASE
jgi:endonuclease YncB( thermonuclease family)